MRRLILHVGPGRTGTSALQCMFARSSAAMLAQGVYFPTWPGMAEAAVGAVSSGNGGALVAMIAPRAGVKHYTESDAMDALRALHDQPAMTVLYSHEGMALFEPDRLAFLADMAASAGFVTQAAYYTRNRDDYSRSVYARWSSTSRPAWRPPCTMSWNEWDSTFTPPFGRHVFELQQLLGVESVFVRDYDAAKPDLFGDFCVNVLGIERPQGQMPWINASVTETAWHSPARKVSDRT